MTVKTPDINILLREARESRGVTIDDAAKTLKLRKRHIKMLEDGKFDELSREIYLKGFIKTYSSWLNVSSTNIDSKTSPKKKEIVRRRAVSKEVDLGFSYIDRLVRRYGISVVILTAIFFFCLYFFLEQKQKQDDYSDTQAHVQKAETEQKTEKYSNIIDKYFGKDLVLFAHSDVEFKITETISGTEKQYKLVNGEVLFLKATDDMFITTEWEDDIEVFLDIGSTQEPIGTLDDILIKY